MMNEFNLIQMPYIHALTIARVCFEGAYIIDDGSSIYLCVFNETNTNFIKDVLIMFKIRFLKWIRLK